MAGADVYRCSLPALNLFFIRTHPPIQTPERPRISSSIQLSYFETLPSNQESSLQDMAPPVFPAHRIVFYLTSLDLPHPAIRKLVEMKLAIICDVEDQLKQFEALVKEDFKRQQDPNLLKFSAPKLVAGIEFDKTFNRAFSVTPKEIETLRPVIFEIVFGRCT